MPFWKAFLLTPVIIAVAFSIRALASFLIVCAIKFIVSLTPFTIEQVVMGVVALAFWAFIAWIIQGISYEV